MGLAIYSAIFSHSLAEDLAPKIAAAALPLGLPKSSLGALIGTLASGDTAALADIPGIKSDIIGAGFGALQDAYSIAFRWVWVAAACFSALAVVCKFYLPFLSYFLDTLGLYCPHWM